MKKYIVGLSMVLLSFSLGGCGSTNNAETQSSTEKGL